MRTTRHRLIGVVGAVAFGTSAVVFALRDETVSTVMAVIAAALAIVCAYQVVRKPDGPR